LDAGGQPITYPGGRPTVGIPPTGCGAGTVVGFVHSHPGSGAHLPSSDDFDYADWHTDYNDAPDNFGIYVISSHADAQGQQVYRVSRADRTDRAAAANGTLVPNWINPDATPCAGGS
jgi:hypothetical protein